MKRDYSHLQKISDQELESMLAEYLQREELLEELYTQLLPKCYIIAANHSGGKVLLEDLVSEANLRCFEVLKTKAFTHTQPYLKSLEMEIEGAIQTFIKEEEDSDKENRGIVDKLNQLIEAVEVLKEQNAIYSMEELSEFLDIPIEEIRNLLRIAGQETDENDE